MNNYRQILPLKKSHDSKSFKTSHKKDVYRTKKEKKLSHDLMQRKRNGASKNGNEHKTQSSPSVNRKVFFPRQRAHYAGEGFISTDRTSIHTNPSRKRINK